MTHACADKKKKKKEKEQNHSDVNLFVVVVLLIDGFIFSTTLLATVTSEHTTGCNVTTKLLPEFNIWEGLNPRKSLDFHIISKANTNVEHDENQKKNYEYRTTGDSTGRWGRTTGTTGTTGRWTRGFCSLTRGTCRVRDRVRTWVGTTGGHAP